MGETLKLPEADRIGWSFDEEADVLYISFGEPRPAIGDYVDGVLIRDDESTGEIVGITIVGVSEMLKKKQSPDRAGAAPPK